MDLLHIDDGINNGNYTAQDGIQLIRRPLVIRRGGANFCTYSSHGKIGMWFSPVTFRLTHPGRPYKSNHSRQSSGAGTARVGYFMRASLKHVSMGPIDIHRGVKFKMIQNFLYEQAE